MFKTILTCGTIVLVGSAVLFGGCTVRVDSEGYRAVEEQQFDVAAEGADVTLVTFDGSIEVRSWDRAEVFVEIIKRGSSKEFVDALVIHTEAENGGATIEARRPAEIGSLFGMDSDGSVTLVVSVPERSNLVARSGDGQISVERLNGRLELRTEDGRIRGIDVEGEIIASTADGPIDFESVDGRVELTSGDGRVNVDGRMTGLQIETGDGSVRVRAANGSSMETDWDIWTGDGGIVMTVPSDLDADIDAQTADGSVRIEDDALTEVEMRDRRHLRGRLGEGGNLMRIRTAEGSIRLRLSRPNRRTRPAREPSPTRRNRVR